MVFSEVWPMSNHSTSHNTLYLGLLVATYVSLRLPGQGACPERCGVLVLLRLALVLQGWHEVEHVFKLAQYLQFGPTAPAVSSA